MKNKFIPIYAICALFVLSGAVLWFVVRISSNAKAGALEADRSFSWLVRSMETEAAQSGFMSAPFIDRVTALCAQSRLVAAVCIATPSGTVYAWPERSPFLQYDVNGQPQVVAGSFFTKAHSANLDIGDNAAGSVVLTAVVHVLPEDAIFSASRDSFLLILAVVLVTLIVIIAVSPAKARQPVETARPLRPTPMDDRIDDTAVSTETYDEPDAPSAAIDVSDEPLAALLPKDDAEESISTVSETVTAETESPAEFDAVSSSSGPEGLYSPYTGLGWEQYLVERLDSELQRAASSEQDLALFVIRVSGLVHTDLLARKISKVLADSFKFRDLVFEYGQDGFAGIVQNINLDQAMKLADGLYAEIDSILMSLSYNGQITIGITTRTARLLPASRMIEEASSAARKAIEEPSLPIVAFRANPEKYRSYVAENA